MSKPSEICLFFGISPGSDGKVDGPNRFSQKELFTYFFQYDFLIEVIKIENDFCFEVKVIFSVAIYYDTDIVFVVKIIFCCLNLIGLLSQFRPVWFHLVQQGGSNCIVKDDSVS